jgi:hypothetical protein
MVGRAKVKYRCQCCSVTPRGCDLKKHYKNLVNWPLVKLLKAAKGTELQELRDRADRHTLFIFDRGYSEENLPSYQNHAEAKEAGFDEEENEAGPSRAAGGQRGITAFFQVILAKKTVLATLIRAVFVRISFQGSMEVFFLRGFTLDPK